MNESAHQNRITMLRGCVPFQITHTRRTRLLTRDTPGCMLAALDGAPESDRVGERGSGEGEDGCCCCCC